MAKTVKIAADRPIVTLNDLERIDADVLAANGYHDYVSLSDASLDGRDLRSLTFSESELSGVSVSDVDLSHGRISDSRLSGLTGTKVKGIEPALRNTEVEDSRLGVLELGDADLKTVLFERCKFGFVNLRGTRAVDVTFEDCVIEELDLTGATIMRLSLRGSSIRTLTLSTESATALDLREAELTALSGTDSLHGVILGEHQLMQFAGQFVRQLGGRVM